MKNYTLGELLKASGGQYFGAMALLNELCVGISTDSREIKPGFVFAAIPGERVDGHDFAAQAARDGALCLIAEKALKNPGAPYILVPSTLSALRAIAADYRESFDIPVIGITGSVGKTSAKEMIARTLETRFDVLYTLGNFNNELGVPLTLFRLLPQHDIAVVEMGISDFGEMSRLTRMVKPTAAVFTSIGDAHLMTLGSREGILRAKSEILEGMPAGGTVFVNGDNELLMDMNTAPQKKLSFGLDENCDLRASDIANCGAKGFSCRINGLGKEFNITIPAYGKHLVYAALSAASLGIHFGLSDAEIAAGILNYAPVGHRARIINARSITIVDDCYNANPTSVLMALSSLEDFRPRRRVAILGDMLELGENEEALHHDLGIAAAASGAVVITCGTLSRNTANGVLISGGDATHFEDKESLLSALGGIINPDDAVLVKASRGMHLEDIVSKLTENF